MLGIPLLMALKHSNKGAPATPIVPAAAMKESLIGQYKPNVNNLNRETRPTFDKVTSLF